MKLFVCARCLSQFRNISSNIQASTYQVLTARTLYHMSASGLEKQMLYERRTMNFSKEIKEQFWIKLQEYVNEKPERSIHTTDINSAFHLAETDAQIDLSLNLIRRYLGPNGDKLAHSRVVPHLLVSSFAKMLCCNNKSDMAFDLLKSQDYQYLFLFRNALHLYMNMWFSAGKYEYVIEAAKLLYKKNRTLVLQSRAMVLTAASFCKINTPEALDECLKMADVASHLAPRAATFIAFLALKQNKPEAAYRSVCSIPGPMNMNFRPLGNLMLLALLRLGRHREAIAQLNDLINRDELHVLKLHLQLFPEAIAEIEHASQTTSPGIAAQYVKVLEELRMREGYILSQVTLDDFIFQPIYPRRDILLRSFTGPHEDVDDEVYKDDPAMDEVDTGTWSTSDDVISGSKTFSSMLSRQRTRHDYGE